MIYTQTKFSFVILLFLYVMYFVISEKQSYTVPEDIVTDLYLKYKEAVNDDRNNTSQRRLLKHKKQYEVHVKKLKEVNGFKIHNLMIKEDLRTDKSPLIYINNPVESKIPQAYLTLDEFKNILTNRVIKQRMELSKNITKDTKHQLGLKTTVTQNILRVKANSRDSVGKTFNKIHTISYNDLHIESNVTKPELTFTKNENITLPIKKLDLNNVVSTTEINISELVKNVTQSITANYTTETTLNVTMIESPLTTNNYVLKTALRNVESSKIQLEVSTIPKNVPEILQDTTASLTSLNTEQANNFNLNEYNTSFNTNLSMTTQITRKEKPRRKVKTKITPEPTTKTKRITLGRPLVFLGN